MGLSVFDRYRPKQNALRQPSQAAQGVDLTSAGLGIRR